MNLDYLYGGTREYHHHLTFDLQGADNLISDLMQLIPSEKISLFTREWANIVEKSIVAKAPKKSGDLQRGICVSNTPEQSIYSHKAVWDVWFASSFSDIFVKISKNGKRYYYPASQNYGFDIPKRTTIPNAPPGKNHVPGIYFMQEGLADVAPAYIAACQSLIDEVIKNG